MHRILKILLCALISVPAFAQQAPPQQTVDEQLAPWRAYYNQQETWPRSHGWKPFKRFEWDMMQRSYGTGYIPAGAIWEAFQERERMPRAALDETWVNLGPANHGGRTRVLRFHPDDPNTMFAGSVGGGLWKSIDAGNNWFPITEHLPNIAIGCFEIDLTNPQVMYLGTGEGYYNSDGLAGIGLLKSVDGGQTWNTTGLSYEYNQGMAVLCIDVDPINSNIVLASTNNGLRRSTDGAGSFTTVLQGDVKALVRDPITNDILLAAPGNPFGSGVNGVYRSEDNGETWVRSSEGLPPATQIGRIVLSFYPGNSQIVYAGVCGTFTFNNTQMIGIFRSVDNGQSWTQMSNEGVNHYASQGWYDMAIAVKPDQSTVVLSSGLDLWKSTNSGLLWSRKTRWDFPFGNPDYVHADHHEIVFHPDNSSEVWAVNDGGIFRSTDVAENWTEMSDGYVTFQYYAMGNATLDTALAYAGAQDNGSTRYDGTSSFDHVFGGDGGYCVVDYTDDNTVYVEWQGGNRYRSDNGGNNFVEINPGIDGGGAWVTPMALDPFDNLSIYTTTSGGSGRVWKSANQGRNADWDMVGSAIGGELQCIEGSQAQHGRFYVASNSSVFRYDGTGDWINVTGNLPGAWVTRVVPDPSNPDLVYVTVSGFSTGHVWKSTSAGNVWANISGNLPDIPFQDVVVDRNEPNTLYAGSDLGAYFTTNGGQTWSIYGDGLPAVRIDDMDLQTNSGKLRIATHGRGMWEIPTSSAVLSLLFPNGGEELSPGETINLRWAGVAFGGNVRIEINRDYPGGAWQNVFASTPNDGNQNWTVTGPESDHVRFRIWHITVPQQTDSSNGDSRIVNPGLTLLWPNGAENVLSGVRDSIRFERTLVTEPLIVELNRDYPNGVWDALATDVTSQDLLLWAIQLPGGTNCRVRVKSTTRPEIFDESDASFILRAPLMTITAPSGGEQLQLGIPFNVTWQAAEHQDRLRLFLNRNYPGGAWELIAPNTANDGAHPWAPAGLPSTTCRLRMTTLLDPNSMVESPADFTILGTAVDDDNSAVPTSFIVHEPYPNPFNPVTEIKLELPARMKVHSVVFNRLGQEVATLKDDVLEPGLHTLHFDGSDLSSGVYFIQVSAGDETVMLKAALIK